SSRRSKTSRATSSPRSNNRSPSSRKSPCAATPSANPAPTEARHDQRQLRLRRHHVRGGEGARTHHLPLQHLPQAERLSRRRLPARREERFPPRLRRRADDELRVHSRQHAQILQSLWLNSARSSTISPDGLHPRRPLRQRPRRQADAP